jgi:hypothetical protein
MKPYKAIELSKKENLTEQNIFDLTFKYGVPESEIKPKKRSETKSKYDNYIRVYFTEKQILEVEPITDFIEDFYECMDKENAISVIDEFYCLSDNLEISLDIFLMLDYYFNIHDSLYLWDQIIDNDKASSELIKTYSDFITGSTSLLIRLSDLGKFSIKYIGDDFVDYSDNRKKLVLKYMKLTKNFILRYLGILRLSWFLTDANEYNTKLLLKLIKDEYISNEFYVL